MRLNDALSGLLAIGLGIAVAAYARTFPGMPGQPVGPGLFPMLIGGLMVALGTALTLSGLRRRTAPWMAFDSWVGRPRMLFNFALVVAVLVFYALAVDWLGFFLTSFLFLGALFLAFGVPRRWIAPVAIAVTFAIHYGFYTLLRVPLPWGLLGGIAW